MKTCKRESQRYLIKRDNTIDVIQKCEEEIFEI